VPPQGNGGGGHRRPAGQRAAADCAARRLLLTPVRSASSPAPHICCRLCCFNIGPDGANCRDVNMWRQQCCEASQLHCFSDGVHSRGHALARNHSLLQDRPCRVQTVPTTRGWPWPVCSASSGPAASLASPTTCEMLIMSFTRRRAILPLVNKRWARVLRGPSHAWRVAYAGCTCAYCYEERDERAGQYLEPLSSTAATLHWFTSRVG